MSNSTNLILTSAAMVDNLAEKVNVCLQNLFCIVCVQLGA